MVILIISIIIGIAVMVPRRGDSHVQMKDEATRLAFLFNAASEQALLSGAEVGFSLNEDTYRWWQWDRANESWLLLNKGSWGAYRLPDNVTLLVMTANESNLQDNIKGPATVFYSDGLTTPARLTFSTKGDKSYQLILETDGVTPLDER